MNLTEEQKNVLGAPIVDELSEIREKSHLSQAIVVSRRYVTTN